MVNIILNNERIFDKNIIQVLKESPELLEIFETSLDYLSRKNISNEEVKIVNDLPYSPKENYDVLYNDDYVGNIILLYEDVTKFWSIYILIFPKYRRNGYAKNALYSLINLYPDRNWEANIFKKNERVNSLQNYLLDLRFEKTEFGKLISQKEIVFNYRKAKNKIITVIASAYFEPISDLLNNLLKRSTGKVNDVQTSQVENGYSVALCILLVACFESYVMRDIYFKKDPQIKTPLEYISTCYNNFPYLAEITECYIIRDLIMHNHVWEIDHSYYEFKIINSSIMPFSGDSKFKANVDLINRVTNKLKLNIVPIRINRNDIKKVLQVVWESLNHLSKSKDSEIYLTNTTVIYDGKVHSFKEVYNKFIERV